MSMKIESYDPYTSVNGSITTAGNLVVTGTTCTLPSTTTIGGSSVSALGVITSASANSLTVGLNGATNPAFNVDSSTASQAAGLNVTGAIAAGTVAVAVISSGGNANLSIDAKGSGTVTVNGTATGKIVLARSVDVVSAGVIAGLGTGTNGITLKNLKNSAASSLSGTNVDITIDIGGTPYYFTVYPTKA